MKVCQTCKGKSYLWKYVILVKVCHTFEGMSYFWRYVIFMKVCHFYEGMSHLWRYVTLIKVCHTYEGKSNKGISWTWREACVVIKQIILESTAFRQRFYEGKSESWVDGNKWLQFLVQNGWWVSITVCPLTSPWRNGVDTLYEFSLEWCRRIRVHIVRFSQKLLLFSLCTKFLHLFVNFFLTRKKFLKTKCCMMQQKWVWKLHCCPVALCPCLIEHMSHSLNFDRIQMHPPLLQMTKGSTIIILSLLFREKHISFCAP